MFYLGMTKQLVNVLEYPSLAFAIRTRKRVRGRGISRLCLRPQGGHKWVANMDIAGHFQGRVLGSDSSLGDLDDVDGGNRDLSNDWRLWAFSRPFAQVLLKPYLGELEGGGKGIAWPSLLVRGGESVSPEGGFLGAERGESGEAAAG